MSKDPAFLFYSSDFMTGVADLTMEERGQYITLLCLQHQKGRLTTKAVALAVANPSQDVLDKFKIDENGLYYSERLEKEMGRRKAYSEKQRERAKEGWKKRKQTKAVADAVALPLMENENENEIRDTNENRGIVKGDEACNDAAEKFCDQFNVGTYHFLEAGRFISAIDQAGRLKEFITQTDFYFKVKEAKEERLHRWKNYLAPENKWQDGVWLQTDWKAEFEKLQPREMSNAEKLRLA
ncbi:MAG: YdaU family protein [bacterium]|nr:YdaU family protein [bacterium]